MTTSAKKLIHRIRNAITESEGAPATRADVARSVGVSATAIANWEGGRSRVTEESFQKLEEALAKYGGAATDVPSEVAPRKKANKGSNGQGHSGIRSLVAGVKSKSSRTDDDPKKEAYGTPVWNGMKIPNQKAEEAKLREFIATVGIKQLGPAGGVLCDDGSVFWYFVAEFSPKAMATIIKKLNEHNRQVGPKRAEQYALDMANDDWGWTGEPILFSRTGDLLNGQNRMLAGRACGRPLVFMVGYGLAPTAIKFMDRQMVRNNNQQGQAEGWSFNHVRGLTLGLFHRYEKSKDGSTDFVDKVAPGMLRINGPRNTELKKAYQDEMDPALEFIHGLRWGIGARALPKHIGVFMFMLMSRKSPEAARYFMLSLVDGTHAMPGSPAYTLRHKLTKMSADKAADPSRFKVIVRDQIGHGDTDAQIARGTEALIMRNIAGAWNSFCAGKKNSTGKFTAGFDNSTTTEIVSDLATPGPRALKESEAFTTEALEAVVSRARAVAAAEAKKAYDKNRDAGDVKHAAITKALKTV